jgi:hypothetical protein
MTDEKPKLVTQDDIDAAIIVAQVEGTAPLCDYSPEHFRCLIPPHCKSCDCKGTGWSSPKCEHDSEWDCICAAIGGSDLAANLFLAACSEVYHWLHSEHDDCDESCGDTLSFVDPAARGTELFNSDLEVAALLADGWLPAGWST